MVKISKKKILLGIPVALVSLEIYFGMLAGYLTGKIFAGKKVGQQGLIKSIRLDFGNRKIHFHHWLTCIGMLVSAFFLNFWPPFARFFAGGLIGMIFHGISSYSDWHKIFKKS